MLSGYTRETAVKILLERKKKQNSNPPSSASSVVNPVNTVNNSNSNSKRLSREPSHERMMTQQQLFSDVQKGGSAGSSGRGGTSSNVNAAMLPTIPSIDTTGSENHHHHPIAPVRSTSSSYDQSPHQMPPQLQQPQQQPQVPGQQRGLNHGFQSEYEAMLHHQATMLQQMDITSMTPPRQQPASGQYTPSSSAAHPPIPPSSATSHYSAYDNMGLPPPSHRTPPPSQHHHHPSEEFRILREIPSDERAFRIGILISQQEMHFGTNMYQSINTVDASEMTTLIARGFNEDEAALILFERKYGKTPAPPVSSLLFRFRFLITFDFFLVSRLLGNYLSTSCFTTTTL
jgi:hypothetical protein